MNKRGFMLIKLLVIVAVIAIIAAEALGDGLNCQREVWVAIRDDGKPGSGTVTDPFDGGTVAKLNGLFSKFVSEYGDNITMHFGPGVFYGDRRWWPKNNWKIRGAGMDITVFKTQPNPDRIKTVGFWSRGYNEVLSGFEISDVTFDFNVSNLRRPNRAFVAGTGKVTYVYVDAVSQWSAKTKYKRGQTIQFQNSEFIALKASRGKAPAQGGFWSVLCSTQPADLPVWDTAGIYCLGEVVAKGERVYLCVESGPQNSDPSVDAVHWQAVDPNAIDPAIRTRAVFIHGQPPSGGHRATRVKVINGNGSRFFNREEFLIALGGNDCVIEDCIVEQFRGDYATLIIVTYGQNSVVRGCVVRGNDESSPYAYGGWACWNTIFENNFCSNVDLATNIDSLTSRNVTFRGNTFLDCRKFGIHVYVNGRIIESCRRYSMTIDGKTVTDADFARSCMDGLYIYDNYIQIRDDAPGGAIYVQGKGLSNVVIRGNTLRTTSGSGRVRAIVAFCGENAIVYDNLCETNMYCEIMLPAVLWHNNVNLLGQPMKNFHGQPITGPASPEPGTPVMVNTYKSSYQTFQPLDISAVANRSLETRGPQGWPDVKENDLREFETGNLVLAGIPAQVSSPPKSCLILGPLIGRMATGDFPKEATFPVGKKADAIFFLQTSTYGAASIIYTVNYEDGEHMDIPIIGGKDLWDWWKDIVSFSPPVKLAWKGANNYQIPISVYWYEWKNPQPKKAIQNIHVGQPEGERTGNPVILGITLAYKLLQ